MPEGPSPDSVQVDFDEEPSLFALEVPCQNIDLLQFSCSQNKLPSKGIYTSITLHIRVQTLYIHHGNCKVHRGPDHGQSRKEAQDRAQDHRYSQVRAYIDF